MAAGGNFNMKQFRASMALDANAINKQRASVAVTISRASQPFQLKDGTDAGNLVIENERLKTTIMVLSQKLQTQCVTHDETKSLQ